METAPRLVIPQLRSFYQWAEPISWLLIRLTAGLMIIPHGWPKLMMGVQATAQMALVKRGIQPAEPLAILLIILETIGGLCVALGLFTLVVNAVMLMLTAWAGGKLGVDFRVDGFLAAFLGALVVSIVSTLLSWFVAEA